MKNQKSVLKRTTAFVLAIALIFCLTVTAFAADSSSTQLDPYQKYLTIKNIFMNYEVNAPTTSDMLDSVMKELLTTHPELFSDVINAMVKTNEKYTGYYDAETYQKYFSGIDYYGIGVTVAIKEDDLITITEVYNGTGKEAGLQVGDKIIKVNDIDVTSSTIQYVGTLIKGSQGTSVMITIQRPSTNETKNFDVKRGPVTTPNVSYKILDNNIAYMNISSFDGIQTWIDFCDAQEKLNAAGITKYIIDVRNNRGGDATVVFNMLNQMIEEKGVLITTVKTTTSSYPMYSRGVGKKFKNLVVLANENSYSAAEVFAGVVKDLKLGVVVGTTTGGKGVGQQYIPFRDGSYFAVTSEEIVLPVTGVYHKIGIIPSVRVSNKIINPDVSWLVSLKDYTKPINPGSQSSVVKGVEQRLKVLGYLDNIADEKYDTRSVEAVKQLQKENSMYEDGVISASIINLLNSKIKEYSKQEIYDDTQMKAALSILQ